MGYSNVAGDLNVYSTTLTESLTVRGDTALSGNLVVNYGTTILKNVVADRLTVTGNFIITATNTQATNALSINNSGTATALTVTQSEGGGPGHIHNVAEFWDYTTLAMVVDPRGNVAIHASASPGYALTVNDGALFDNVTSGYFIGDASNLTNIQAVQVTGGLSAYQLQTTQTNITSVGTLTNLAVSGVIYGTVAGANTVSASGFYGPITGSNTIAASTVTATDLVGNHYGPINGANTVSASTVTATNLVGNHYGPITGANTVSATTITGTDIIGTTLYGPLAGANTIAATTITGTDIIGTTLYGPLAGANTVSATTITGTSLTGTHYGPLAGANTVSATTITGTSISGTTLYGPIAGANTIATSGLYGPIVGANTIAASTITGTNLIGTHYGPLAGSNTISASTITATSLLGDLYGPVIGSNTVSASTVTATNLVGSTIYGPIAGSNTIVGSTLYGTLAGANTITGSSISGTNLYGPIAGSNTISASTVAATSLTGTHYGPLAGSNTISASTVAATSLTGTHYGPIEGSNTISASTVAATSLTGTHYGPLTGSNTISASTVAATSLTGTHYGPIEGSNTISASSIAGTTLYGPIAGSNTIAASTIYGQIAGSNTIAASTIYGQIAGSNTIAASTVTATSLVGTLYGPIVGSNTIAASTVSATSLVGTLYGPIEGSNTISASTIYGSIAGSNTITASTIYGSIAGSNTISASSLTLGTALSIGNGGTGQTSEATAITALTGTQTSGKYLRSDGINSTLSTLDMGDAGAGTLAVGRGGTGATTSTGTGSVVLAAGPSLTGTTSIATLNLTNALGTVYGGTGADGSAVTTNKVLASPNGSTGGVTYRALASEDLPTVTFSPGSAGTYGSTTAIPTIVIDTYGRITGISTSAITTLSGLTTYGVLYASSATTATTTAVGSAGQALLSSGSGVAPTYGTLGIAYGGTGQTNASAGFNALSPMTTLGDLIYGAASGSGTRLAGSVSATAAFLSQTGSGTVSAAPSWVLSTGTGSVVLAAGPTLTGTTSIATLNLTNALGLAYGGTGQTSAQTSMNALAAAVTSGSYLRGNGTNVVMSAIQAGDVPTLNQSTTGSAGSLSTTFTNGYVLYGQGTGVPAFSASLTWDGTSLAATNVIGTHYGPLAGSNTISGSTLTLTNALGVAYGGTGTTTSTGTGSVVLAAGPSLTGTTSIATLNLTNALGTVYGGTGADGSAVTTNKVLASPNGSTGGVTYRALASADLPTVTFSPGSAGTYGSATSAPTIVVDMYGRITGISTSTTSSLSGLTTYGVLYGSSATTAASTAVGTSGQPLLSGGIGAAPSYGTLAVAYGGTGQTTATAGFNALSPMTTLGDLIYGAASGSGTRLAGSVSATAAFLSQTGTGTVSAAPSWVLSTGTGSVVLSAGPTLTGTTTIGTLNVNGTATIASSTLTLPTVLATTSVGVGTNASPPNKLSVSSTTAQLPSSVQISHTTGDWGLVIKRNANDPGSCNFAFLKSRGETSVIIAQGDSIGRFSWHAVTNVTGPVVQQLAEINVTNTTFTGGNADGTMIFLTKQTTDSVPVERMRILPSGFVGIGTNNPGTALQVNGTVTATTFSGSAASLTTFPTLNQNTTGSSGSCTGNSSTATTATNQSGGTVSATTGAFSGIITLPTGGGTNEIGPGTGDGASYSTYNVYIRTWWGLAIRDHVGTVRMVADARNGIWDVTGGYKINGTTVIDSSRNLTNIGTVTATSFSGSAASLTSFPTLNQNTTGSSGSCTGSAAQLGSLTKSQLWNNSGQNHTTYTTFASLNSLDFGNYFAYAATDGPNGSGGYYVSNYGLGNDYAFTQFAMQTALQRNTTGYFWVRYRENSGFGAWTKIYAGFADSATTATNQSGGTVAATTGTFSGNVGIGITNPGNKLQIAGGDSSTALFGPNTTWGAYLYVGSGVSAIASGKAQVISTNGNLHLDSGNGQTMYLQGYNSGFLNAGGGVTSYGTFTMVGDLNMTGNATRIRFNSTSIWSGDTGAGFGKLEYHAQRWYINAGTDSDRIVQFRRGPTDVSYIDNSGTYIGNISGSAGSATTAAACSGNSLTATTATNQSGGTVSATSIYTSGNITINNGAPTITFQDSDQMSAYWHNNSNLMYLLRGPINAGMSGWVAINGEWPVYWDLSNNNARFGGALSVVGDVTAFVSDERLKTKVGLIENALDKVCSLTAFKYTHNEIARQKGFTEDLVYVGLSAQEVQKVLPEVVKPAPFDYDFEKGGTTKKSKSGENYLTVQYDRIVSLLVEAVKEERAERLKVEARLARLEKLLLKE